MLDLSIVVVSWNARAFVRKCLASLESACAGLKAEVFLVDNASSDGTPEMVRDEFPFVRLIRNASNLGFARANNIGIRLTSAKYLCLVNSDVTVPPGCLETLLEYMEANPSAGMIGPAMLTPAGSVGPSCMRRPTLGIWLAHALGLGTVLGNFSLHLAPAAVDTPRKVDVLNGWFWTVRRSALDRVGLLAEDFFMYGEDIDWCHRFREAGWDIVYVPAASAVHYGGGSSARAPVSCYVEMQRANLQYWKRYHGPLSQLAYKAIVFLHQLLRVVGYGMAYPFRVDSRPELLHKIKRSFACLRWLFGLYGARPA